MHWRWGERSRREQPRSLTRSLSTHRQHGSSVTSTAQDRHYSCHAKTHFHSLLNCHHTWTQMRFPRGSSRAKAGMKAHKAFVEALSGRHRLHSWSAEMRGAVWHARNGCFNQTKTEDRS